MNELPLVSFIAVYGNSKCCISLVNTRVVSLDISSENNPRNLFQSFEKFVKNFFHFIHYNYNHIKNKL